MADTQTTDQKPTDPPPMPEKVLDIFAGGDPIVEENLGNIEEFYSDSGTPVAASAANSGTPQVPDNTPQQPVSTDNPKAVEPAVPQQSAPETAPAPTDSQKGSAEGNQPDQQAQQPAAQGNAPQDANSGEVVQAQQGDEQTVPVEEGQVPSFRLAQEAARRRQAEARAAEMEQRVQMLQQSQLQPVAPQPAQVPGQPAPAPQNPPQGQAPAPQEPVQLELDFGDDPKQMFDKVLDGDLDKATELLSNMLKKTAAQTAAAQHPATQQQPMPQDQVQQMVQQQMREQQLRNDELAVVAKLEASVPEFNPTHEKYNKELVEETLALQQAYMQKMYTPAEAMDRAAEAVLRLNDINRPAPSQAPAATAAPDPKNVERKVAAAQAQPPQMPQGTQNQQPAIDINNLSDEEFDALPEATIARLRGDFG